MEKIFSDQFKINTTPNLQNTFCFKNRPCYRYSKCVHCRTRHRYFLTTQGYYLADLWRLEQFTTISFPQVSFFSEYAAIEFLRSARGKICRKIAESGKYFSCLGIGQTEATAHIHFVTTKIERSRLKSFLDKKTDCKSVVNIQDIQSPLNENVANVIGYCYDQNFLFLQKYRSHMQRLLTASRGFYTGKFNQQSNFPFGEVYGEH